mmetsp:Transcript_40689/g.109975  ORF Transcript_40689/g.109975 Transcript_40689/m.109975 type:complete len:432 (-) Transcript_40689:104-1399(-)
MILTTLVRIIAAMATMQQCLAMGTLGAVAAAAGATNTEAASVSTGDFDCAFFVQVRSSRNAQQAASQSEPVFSKGAGEAAYPGDCAKDPLKAMDLGVTMPEEMEVGADAQTASVALTAAEEEVGIEAGQAKDLATIIVLIVVLAVLFVLGGPKHSTDLKKPEKLEETRAVVEQDLQDSRQNLKDLVNFIKNFQDFKDSKDFLGKKANHTELCLCEMPNPIIRLPSVGASYVVPRERVANSSAKLLVFDIPTLPFAGPLCAHLSRPCPWGPWTEIKLTMDVIAASGLPRLLCTRSDTVMPLEEIGGDGVRGFLMDEAAITPCTEDLLADESEEDEAACPWLTIYNAEGIVVAMICRRRNGSIGVQHRDCSAWDMEVDINCRAPSITVSKQGQELSHATSFRDKHLQVDTQAELQSPESVLLLMCTLAVLTFR